jgi:hypothetical protein
MNPVPVLKVRMAGPKTRDVTSYNEESLKPENPPISILSFLQAENIRLRQQAVELAFEIAALKQAQQT